MPKPVAQTSVGKLLLCVSLACALLGNCPAWAGDCACTPCDFDQDGDVDLADFGHLQLCLSGTGVIQSNPACEDAKLAGHTFIDQQDVAIFRACLGGDQKPFPGTDLPDVVISEFLANNDGGLADEDGDHPDWIEIHVPCRPSLDLEGWFLTDDPANLQKWAFPAITMGRGDYLLVFASGKDRRTAGQPLHTNFQLEKDGEYLALVAPDGQTVVHAYAPQFPAQLSNVSYGMAQGSVSPVARASQASYYVPVQADAALGTTWTDRDFPDAAWNAGPTGLGFSSVPSTFTVTTYRANVVVGNLATADAVLADPSKQSSVTTAQVSTINLYNGGDAGHFGGDQPFPGMTLATNVDNFVTLTTGTVVIPVAGEWTFGVNSDEGFRLTLTLGSQTFTSSYPDLRTASDTLKVFNFTQPGVYSLRLEQFDRTGGSSLELFAAQGYYSMFDPGVFRLVGDVAGGGLVSGGAGVDVLTNVGAAMCGVNSSIWVRIPFDLEDPSPYTGMKLKIRYVDGFTAYLNGQEITRRNAPGSLAWNSAATARRTGQTAATVEEIDLAGFHSLLQTGRNVLAIHGLNDTAADGDFAIVPELVLSSNSMQPQYFPAPTPGEPNSPGVLDWVQPVQLNQEHGFRTAAFPLAITCPTPGAEIRYTFDGSTPTATTGQVYSEPFTISGTSVVRAAAFKPGWLQSGTVTRTYLFVSDVIYQSQQGQAPGSGWPAPGTFNGQVINYGMDPDVTNDSRYAGLIDDALLAIPSISVVTDLPNLFSLSAGIYTHANNDGVAWERPCSVELINPDGTPGFQIDAGLRIRGGYSRVGANPKHGFRLFFRGEYGQKELEYPLFGSEGVDHFKHIDLRTEHNFSWSFYGDARNTMVRDPFVRELQGAMGDAYTRSRFYHLYLDGQYWGIYQTEERPEADYAASYFGGTDADYDVIKVDWGPFTMYATDGDMDAWHRLWQACQAGFTSDEAYYRVLGLNLDGTRNPQYEVLVDADNLIDCLLLTYYVGDMDGPTSAALGNTNPNNIYTLRNRDGQTGFKSIKHDGEMTMYDLYADRIGPWPCGDNYAQSNPQYVSERLMDNAEYRVRFGDRVQKFMFNGGVLTPEKLTARFLARANQIQTAIIGESARWGDSAIHPPRNREDWQAEINWIVYTYFPTRGAIVLDQLKAKGLYPNVAAPQFSNYGGQVQSGYRLTLSKPAGATGTIYYTTDGTDPRLRGGAIAPSAQVFTDNATSTTFIPAGTTWRYLDTGAEQTGWRTTGFNDTAWPQGAAQLGYGEGDEAKVIGYGPDDNNKYATYYFRKAFNVPANVTCTSLTCRMLCDDGAAIYVNGHTPPVTTSTMPGSWDSTTYCTCVDNENVWLNYTLNPADLNIGNNNVLAVEVHQCAPTSSDLSFDLELNATLSATQPIVIDHNMVVKARILSNGQWSALVEAVFLTEPVHLVINEFMADNKTTLEDPDEPGEYPDWIEIYNPGPVAVSMAGMYLTDDAGAPTKFRIADGISIPANGHLVFFADDDGTQGNLHTTFSLNKAGERIRLTAADGTTVLDEIVFSTQTSDISYGRYPDGGSAWGQMAQPTPGQTNGPLR